MNKKVDQMYHYITGECLFLNVIIIQMTEASPNKKTMKFKKQDPHPVFPPSLVTFNIDHIRDTEIDHVDLSEFLNRIEQSSFYY